jgi:hypothetical protein
MSNTQPHPGDMRAAFTGLVAGAVVLFVILFGIVKMTNAKYAGHEGAKPAAESAH